jgi:putative SOS response-associated peptidase YedK
MCGRFAITIPQDALVNLFHATPANDLPSTPNYNVCPTTLIHTLIATDGMRQLKPTQDQKRSLKNRHLKRPVDQDAV